MSEQLVYALWGPGDLLGEEFRDRLGCEWVQVNLDDAHVAAAQLRITAFDEPVEAFVTLPPDVHPDAVLRDFSEEYAGWRVDTEDSYGFLAVVCDRASAAEELGAQAGDQVLLRPLDDEPDQAPGVTTEVRLGPARATSAPEVPR